MIRTRLQGATPFFPNMLNNGKVEVCLKEDVDKTLAEKDKVIALLKDKANYNEYAYKHKSEEFADTCRFYEYELRHQKFKRCRAMAYVEWLKQMITCNHPESIIYRRAARRERKWKEMADQFKEAK